jgi:hypothetical protein
MRLALLVSMTDGGQDGVSGSIPRPWMMQVAAMLVAVKIYGGVCLFPPRLASTDGERVEKKKHGQIDQNERVAEIVADSIQNPLLIAKVSGAEIWLS